MPLPFGFGDWAAARVGSRTGHVVRLYGVPFCTLYAAVLMISLHKGFFLLQTLHRKWVFTHNFNCMCEPPPFTPQCHRHGVGGLAGSGDTLLDGAVHGYYRGLKGIIMGEKSFLSAFQHALARSSW
ncbi:hypothetical protein ABL78_2166 [Leptomonas seymouri]|uniref:Uncharacterized protein n=1 Tax=Leptomonas seymouri TaxID=5684 RepID=A0A0N0P7E5_LEPSE|nr:hypothetical protein ABL78_2166 [Leptomonas seymouri]|eukprot:KPI88706.1 hypothetical protein ABL78_2166 [Leptomonas seymouri]